MSGVVSWWDDHQIMLYLVAILAGGVLGSSAPGAAPTLEHAINPVLGLLLFATFLGVPLTEVGRGFRDLRFLGAIGVVNFVVVPIVAFGLSRFVADDQGLTLGVLLVLLTPCIDYVIVFTGLAGGDRARLLAAAPLLMLVQMLLLPLYLLVFAGSEVLAVVEPGPFVEAFLVLIIAPFATAGTVQVLARRHRVGRAVTTTMAAAMVPLMMTTLAVVIGSQVAAAGARALELARLVPLYAVFVLLAIAIGLVAGRMSSLDVRGTRAVIFSAATRNSLVVLPLALALPGSLGIAPLAVVTQTMVELVAMIAMVKVVPRLVPLTGRNDVEPSPDHLARSREQ